MTISKNTFRADVFSDVYSVINTKVSDPQGRGKQWIFTSLPDVDAPTFIGYPIIVISKVEREKSREVFDDAYHDDSAPIVITLYSTSNSVLDTLSDSVDAVMIPSNFPQFKFGAYSEDTDDIILNGQNVHTRTMINSVEVDY